ncbi:hypothetical protein DY000_02016332 [Brassica cretica]|uniref:Uncharacterized protein n=1 Tax=Brassica cretica TaxID=69181 RepID=A0ABQ7CX00_BRACR|nr:hypothetical protein DY000_02016332 [Brassica cretica]
MKKLIGLDRLIWTRTEPPLASGQFFGLPGGVSSRTSTDLNPNELGSRGIYRRQQPIRFRLVAARVSLRMAPDACAAAPRAPNGWLHAGRHHSSKMSGCMTRTHARRHSSTHMSISCFSCIREDTSCLVDPPRASTCQAACTASMHGDTSSFWRHSAF